MYGGLIINLIFTGSLQLLWTMINSLQVLTHLALFSLNYPSNVHTLSKVLMNVCNFNLIPLGDFYDSIFEFEEEEEGYSENFEKMDIEGRNAVLNMGTFFLLFLFSFIMIFVVYIFKCFRMKGEGCRNSQRYL